MPLAVDISQVEGASMNKVGKIYTATISSSGQVTIPAEVRKVLGVGKNEEINFKVEEGGITVERPQTVDEFFERQKARIEAEKRQNPAFAKRLEEDAGKTPYELRMEWMNSPEGKNI